MRQRLYRSTRDRRIAGVCGGLAETWDLDPSLVRIAWVILTILTGGVLLVVYVAMAVIVPEGPPGWAAPWPSDRYAAPPSWADWNASAWGPGSPSAFASAPGGSGSAPESTGVGSATTSTPAPGPAEATGEPAVDVVLEPSAGLSDAAGATATWTTATADEAVVPPPTSAVPPLPPVAPPPILPPPPGAFAPPPSTYEPWRDRWDAERPHRRGIGGIVFGLLLVLVGGAFLLRQAIPSIDFDVLWPSVAIALGCVLVAAAFFPRGDDRRER